MTGKELLTFGGYTQNVVDAVWSPNGRRLNLFSCTVGH